MTKEEWINTFRNADKGTTVVIMFNGLSYFTILPDNKDEAIQWLTEELPELIEEHGDYAILIPIQEKHKSIQLMLKGRFNITDEKLQ